MVHVVMLLTAMAAVSELRAVTTLSTGDVSFISAEADSNGAVADGYSIVTWVSLDAGAVLKFTDNGMSDAAATAANTTEHAWTFTVGASGIAAGTTINFGYDSPTAGKWNGPASGTTSSNLTGFTNPGISTSGDQLFVYQGTGTGANIATTPAGAGAFTGTLIAGINFGPTITTGTPTSNNTYAPTSLVNGNAYVNGGNFDNGYYNGVRTGLTNALSRAATTNVTNFTFTETLNASYDRTTSFTLGSTASIYWDANGSTAGDGGAGTWDTTTNDRFKNAAAGTTFFRWVNSSTDNDHTAVFGGTAGTVTVSGGVTASGLQFATTGYTLTASTITLSGASTPTIDTGSLASTTINSALAGTQGFTKSGSGLLTLGGSSTGLSGTVTHNGGIINISNASSLGTGTFTFGGYNRLQINVADGASMTVANNMVLPSAGTGGEAELIRVGDGSPTAGTTARLTGVISGGSSGAIFSLDSDQGSNHNNTLILDNAANTFSGTLELWRGALAFTSDGALGNSNNTIKVNNAGFNGGLRFEANNITTASTRTFQLEGNERIDTQAFASTINGAISGTGSLRKIGSGSLTLGGTNTYSGGTTNVAGGNLRVSGGAAVPDASAVTLDNAAGVGLELLASETVGSVAGGGATGGNINLNDKTLTLAAATATSFAGVISGTGGAMTKTGNSVFTLTGTNTYTGGTNLNAGSLNINNGSALGTGTLSVGTTATGTFLQVANTAAVTLANNMVLPSSASAQRIDLIKNTASSTTGTQINLTGVISGGSSNLTLRVTSDTAGDTTTTYRFAGNNSFSGKVELFRGAIVVANANGLGTAVIQLNGNNNTTLGDLRFESGMTFANNIELVNTSNPDPIHTNGNTVVLSGVITSTGDENLVKIGAGTLTLTGANTYTVGTTVSGGTLQVGNGGTTGSLGSTSGVSNNAALAVNRSNAITISPVISGTGTFEQMGTGTTTLSGTNTYSGTTTASAGVLRLGSAMALPGGIGSTGGTSNLTLNGGVIGLGTGDFTRGLGTGSAQVQFTGSGGFAAYGADRTVNFGGAGAQVTWGSTGFVPIGSSLILGAADSDSKVTIQNPIDFGGGTRTIQVVKGTATGAGVYDAKLAGALSNGSYTQTGDGRLEVAGAITGTTYDQSTTNGTLALTSTITTTGAFTQSGTGSTTTVSGSGAISADSFTQSGAGSATTVTEGGSINSAGAANLNAGTVTLSAASTALIAPTINIGGAAVNLGASEQISDTAAVVLSSGSLGFLGNGKTETVASLTNSGGNFVTGANTLIGTGATITWSGGTNTVSNGGNVQDAHLVISGGTNTVEGGASGGVLQLKTGGAGLEMSNGSTLTLNSDNAVAGRLLLKGDVTTTGNATVTIASGLANTNQGSIDLDSGTRIFTVADGTAANDLQVSAVIRNGALTKAGAGTMTVTAANTYAGTTTVSNGTLQLGNGGTSGSISSSSDVVLSSSTATLAVNRSDSVIINQAITGGGNVEVISGSTILGSDSNSYSGTTTVDSGATLQVGSGGIGKSGTGTTTVNGSGAVLAGTGTVESVTTSVILGTIKPGDNGGDSAGTLDIQTLIFTPVANTTVAELQITGSTAGSSLASDMINITGNLTLNSLSNIYVNGTGYTAAVGDSFTIFDWSGVVTLGSFSTGTNFRTGANADGNEDNLDLPDITGIGFWQIGSMLDAGALSLTIVAVPEPARGVLLLCGCLVMVWRRRR